MGADPVLALNVAAFPGDLPSETVAQILRGGADKVAEAHAVVAGGHTIIDAEPKYGLCVLGLVHPDRILTKAVRKPGDAVYLTKPLGAGLVTTAAKFEEAKPEDLSAAIASMTRLNCCASRMAREAGVRALTDVTGYGILGHAYEMAVAGGAGIRFSASALPLLPGALDYAYRGITTGGGARNRRYLDGKVQRLGGRQRRDGTHPVRPSDLRRSPLRCFPGGDSGTRRRLRDQRAAALACRRGHRGNRRHGRTLISLPRP